MKFLAKKIKKKIAQYERRKHRVNTIIKNTASLPRAIANKSNNATYIQVIDDKGKVIAMMNDFALTGTKTEKAHQLGKLFAQKLKEKKCNSVVFDRNGYLYHGRIKALAEGMREGGVQC